MTPRRGRLGPLAEQELADGLRVVPWVVVGFLLLDVLSGLVARVYSIDDGSPAGLVAAGQKLLTVAAAAAVVWHRPRIALALVALVITLTFTLNPSGEEIWLVLVVGVTAAARYRPRQVALVLAGELVWAGAFGLLVQTWNEDWGWQAALVYLVAATVALAVGLVARRFLHLRDQRRLRVAQLDRERTEIRAVERARLADELQLVVSQGLAGIERELAAVERDRPSLVDLRASLTLVDGRSRSLLGQLGALLTVLRDDQAADAGHVSEEGQRRARFSSPPGGRLLVVVTALAAAGALGMLVRSGTSPYWYALPTGLLCLLATALLGTRGIWAVVLGVAGFSWVLVRTDATDPLNHTVPIVYTAFVGLTVGLVVRHLVITRRDALRQLGDLSDELAQVESEERGAAARELHDVVAHQLSLTTMLVMASSLSEDRDELSHTLNQIRVMTAAAHDELSALVAGMRGRAPDATAPLVPPVASAEALGRRLRESGFDPVLAIDPVADALEPTTQRTLVRIMQEATTNIVRYAPSKSRCDYTLGVEGPEVILTVASLVAGGRQSDLSLGWGLRGAQERIELTGGTFRAGPEDGRWLLTVTLPNSADLDEASRKREPALG